MGSGRPPSINPMAASRSCSTQLAKMMIALPAGALSDRIGRIPVLLLGFGGRITALMMFALFHARGSAVWLLFLVYALSLAISEPAERAIIGDHAHVEQRGTAFGLYHLASGLFVLPGAVLFGAIWQYFAASVAFVTAAIVTATAALLLVVLSQRR